MKTRIPTSGPQRRAFTLVELLVVMAVIAVLSALIFPAAGAIKKRATLGKAKAQLKLVAMAIEAYKGKYGHYPPADPASPTVNPLYFELVGTTNAPGGAGGRVFGTLDHVCGITASSLQTTFGVGGLVNSATTNSAAGDDNVQLAQAFLKDPKPSHYAEIDPGVRVLTCSVEWPQKLGLIIATAPPGTNPWRYVSTGPTNNHDSFDLWVDVYVGGKTNRISNWSETPTLVP